MKTDTFQPKAKPDNWDFSFEDSNISAYLPKDVDSDEENVREDVIKIDEAVKVQRVSRILNRPRVADSLLYSLENSNIFSLIVPTTSTRFFGSTDEEACKCRYAVRMSRVDKTGCIGAWTASVRACIARHVLYARTSIIHCIVLKFVISIKSYIFSL